MGATTEGTKRYFKRHRVTGVELGQTGWTVSPVGFGAYRVADTIPQHAEALKKALLSGVNLIDTSSNYTDGGSERLVGRVLNELSTTGALARDEIVLVTKAGYVQGANMSEARARAAGGDPYPEMVEYDSSCWHCIAPEFLDEQLSRSLDRLGVAKIDVFLLHNPEYFLKVAPDHAEYYERIRKAFAYLETQVSSGRIACYGVSSNSFPDLPTSSEYTSLEKILEIARDLSTHHHFRVIEFPMNLFEPGAALEKNNSGQTLCQVASAAGLGTLVNRPLNAFAENRMIRLADFPSHVGESASDRLQATMGRAAALEMIYPGKEIVPVRDIAWAHIIRENFGRLADLERWKEVLEVQIRPGLDDALEVLVEHAAFRGWCSDYRTAAEELFSSMTVFLEAQASLQSRNIAARLIQACPDLELDLTLSRKCIRIYRSIPGVDCVLVGMRRPEYVEDALALHDRLVSEMAFLALRSLKTGLNAGNLLHQ